MKNYKLIIPRCELNDDDVPNSNLTYDIYWDEEKQDLKLYCARIFEIKKL